ncbi:MAG: hypothetical protein ABR497_00105 [Kiritimatiellia bacterium]
MALTIMATCMAITFGVFYSITKAWQRGRAMADNFNRGEFVMEQLAIGLRSAFYSPPPTNRNDASTDFGFHLTDGGEGPQTRSVISWVKAGPELLGYDTALEFGLHRVSLSVEQNPDGQPALAVRAWRPYTSLLDDFSPEDEPPFFLTTGVQGLACRVSTNLADDGWEWEDIWEGPATNTIPLAVEVTLYLDPLETHEPPVSLQRTVTIPVAPLSRLPRGRAR